MAIIIVYYPVDSLHIYQELKTEYKRVKMNTVYIFSDQYFYPVNAQSFSCRFFSAILQAHIFLHEYFMFHRAAFCGYMLENRALYNLLETSLVSDYDD